jgi:hypothetical protein
MALQHSVSRWLLLPFLCLGLTVGADGPAPCPDESARTGLYRNFNYGFTVTIPRGLAGYWNGASCIQNDDGTCSCMSDHGIAIPLGTAPAEGSLSVFAGHNSEELTLPSRAVRDIQSFLERFADAETAVTSLVSFSFHRHPAYRYRATATLGDGTTVIREATILHTHRGAYSVEVVLEASEGQFRRHEDHLRAILASWRLSPVQ